jgi:hypothetical protein
MESTFTNISVYTEIGVRKKTLKIEMKYMRKKKFMDKIILCFWQNLKFIIYPCFVEKCFQKSAHHF